MDGIEREHESTLTVIRLNIQEHVGRTVGERFDFRFTPTFVFIDAAGNELWRQVGAIDPKEVTRTLEVQ